MTSGMPANFIACDRDQVMLMPPSLLDWVPSDHLVWTVLSSVAEWIWGRSTPTIARTVMGGRRMTR